ncbi:hypothetical protein YTPLAS18_21840 [Nitrospira sp.]|nr:hypothetical protein YTPLAS18_21840 [Nitrospira sp.]
MNLVFLADVSAAHVIGGAERMLREQALGLSRLGHRVQLVTRAPISDSRPHVRIDGVDEWRFLVERDHEVSFLLSTIQRSTEIFDRITARRRPDVVLIHQATAGIGPMLMRRNVPRSWMYMCHSLAHEEYATRSNEVVSGVDILRRSANTQGRYWTEHYVISRCSRVIVLSEFMRDRVLRFHRIPNRRVWQIPGAADPERFQPAADRPRVRRELGLPQDRTILFTVRNLVPRMGLDLLIEAMVRLGEDGHDVMLVIGGEGPMRSALAEQIHRHGLTGRVHLTGFVPEEQLSRYYQAADLVVVPTAQLEGFGLVTVEALACGTPVLGTPIGALPEILRRIDPALVTDSADTESLADGIRRLLRRCAEQPGEQERLARKGRQLIERELNWSQHIVNLESVLMGDQRQQRRAA